MMGVKFPEKTNAINFYKILLLLLSIIKCINSILKKGIRFLLWDFNGHDETLYIKKLFRELFSIV